MTNIEIKIEAEYLKLAKEFAKECYEKEEIIEKAIHKKIITMDELIIYHYINDC